MHTKSITFIVMLGIIILSSIMMLLFPRVMFHATIVEIHDTYLLVSTQNDFLGEELFLVMIQEDTKLFNHNYSHISLTDFSVGDQINVTFNGEIQESYPGRIPICYRVKRID